MSGYSKYNISVDNAYMMPGMSGYGPPDYYPAPSSFSGYGSGGMGSSYGGSGTGAGSSSQGSYPNSSNYTYGYGFMPHGYSSYNPSSV